MRLALTALAFVLIFGSRSAGQTDAALTPAAALLALQAGHNRQIQGVPLSDRFPLANGSLADRPLVACVLMPVASDVPVDWLFDAYPSDVIRVSGNAAGVGALEESLADCGVRVVVVVGKTSEEVNADMESLRAASSPLQNAIARGEALLVGATLGDDLRLEWIGTNVHPATLFGDRQVTLATPLQVAQPESVTASESNGNSVAVFIVGLLAAGGVIAWSLHSRNRIAGDDDEMKELTDDECPSQLREALGQLQRKVRRWQSSMQQAESDLDDLLDDAERAALTGQAESRAAKNSTETMRKHSERWTGPEGVAGLLARVDQLGLAARLLASDAGAGESAESADACIAMLADLRGQLMAALRDVNVPNEAAGHAASALQRVEEQWSQVRQHLDHAREQLGAERATAAATATKTSIASPTLSLPVHTLLRRLVVP